MLQWGRREGATGSVHDVAERVAVAPPLELRRSRRMHWPRYSLPGLTLALVLACASFTPSLAPRLWYVQGIVSGLSAIVGYAIGALCGWLARVLARRQLPAAVRRRCWQVLAVVGTPLVIWSLWLGQRWQHQIHVLTDLEATSYSWVPVLLLTVAVLLGAVAVARGLRWVVRRVQRPLGRLMPQWLAGTVALVLVAVALVEVNDNLVSRWVGHVSDSMFASVNDATSLGTHRPLAPQRSGSPASLVSWASLGRQGRDFVGRGPSVAELTAFSGRPAREPVRVYVGLWSAPTEEQRAALAVRELRRAGAFERAVLVVATTTGTGLVDSSAADAIEYMYDGDTATVGVQYSYLPSWVSFLGDRQPAAVSGRDLFDAVYAAWSRLPEDGRPKLLVTGTSMAVYGSEAAFTGLGDVLRRTDGVVWAGAPYFSRLHERLVERRDPGSPEWQPVYQGGRTVRFASAPSDLRPDPSRPRPRVVYLQYGSDPVVFWSPRLAFDEPDWLAEARAPDVSPDMFWIPIVTFWQLTADLPSVFDVPPGHGHRYRELYADAWAAVAAPKGWTQNDTRRLEVALSEVVPPPQVPPW
jgi:uncharacterized membrane protein